MNEHVTTPWLTEWARDLLQPHMAPPFRYFRSYQHFRRQFDGGYSYLVLDVVTHGHGFHHLAFHLGVRHDLLERRIQQLVGEGPKLDHYARSIRCYTVNIGPASSNWRYPIRGSWSFASTQDTSAAAPEIVQLVTDLAIPYLSEHESLQAVRRTLLETPGRSQTLEPYRQILMIDRILEDQQQAARDLARLDEQYHQLEGTPRRQFEAFRQRFVAVGA